MPAGLSDAALTGRIESAADHRAEHADSGICESSFAGGQS